MLTSEKNEMKEPEALIEEVIYAPEMIGPGICSRCKKPAEELLRIMTFIYYKLPRTGLMVESKWSVDYCIWCLGHITGTLPEEEVEGLYE